VTHLAWLVVTAAAVLFLYAYAVYPMVLRLAGVRRERRRPAAEIAEWPSVSIVVVAYNAERTIRGTLERLLSLDYPAERRQVLVVSDASTDRTDQIVHEYAPRGVELHRMGERRGKTAAENLVGAHVRGEIVISVDASVVAAPDSIKALVQHFSDSTVGVASGRAVGVPGQVGDAPGARHDAAYYDYEMWVRSLEMPFGAVIGATGGLYAMRREVFRVPLAPHVARDFASPLVARERGYRSLIDRRAVCYVHQTPSLTGELNR
jgi:cellulose synthase/poly-beta-1,6-N-acetylglucosamine synthase-like glycosyltransferase